MRETLIEVGATGFVLASLVLSFGLIIVGLLKMRQERQTRRILEQAVHKMHMIAEQRWYEQESSEGVE